MSTRCKINFFQFLLGFSIKQLTKGKKAVKEVFQFLLGFSNFEFEEEEDEELTAFNSFLDLANIS